VQNLLKALEQKKSAYAFDGGLVTPTYYPDAADAALDLLIDEESGIWHLANNTPVSWTDFAKEIADRKGYASDSIKLISDSRMIHDEFFSPNSALKSEKGIALPDLNNALDRFFNTL